MIALADDRWRRRAQRARALADQHASSAEPLRFYAALAELQEQLLQRYRRTVIVEAAAFADRRDPAAAVHVLSEAPGGITRRAPPALRHALSPLDGSTAAIWRERIVTCWRTGARDAAGAKPADLFAIESLLQPFAEHAAAAIDPPQDDSSACPRCGGAAVVAALREQAHGARRWLVCGFCLHEWPAPRLVCTVCGESRVEALPVFARIFSMQSVSTPASRAEPSSRRST